ncbi:HAD family hydrolase [Treponema brennaborense]|uniref:phosphoglycolate phosphatase n=1 Tax=Treponema brennaborense (strain DSM 12168 / CIP 105900 / DD5/3) TaxID=906968 RepID=F4LN40_TREBD|nr:HAD family hydrolase [Treponema brennaborense]AEE15826.1 HAD-superfamily hydrolase, subfamily IA, variant 1 [Treponema brennaborense DSM 12168]
MTVDSILFDLDGTLWDSTEGVCESWNRVFAQRGISLNASRRLLASFFGKPMTAIFDELFPLLSADERDALRKECCAEENRLLADKGGTLYAGVPETLERLSKSYRLFIVSNCQDGYIQTFLNVHGLGGLFEGFESWGRTGLSKGENNLLVIKRFGLKRPVYVGDAAVDEQSAAAAGIPFVYAAYGFGTVGSFNASISSFPEIERTLQRLNGHCND